MKNRATKFLSLALCAVVLFAAVGTSVFALTGEGKESEDGNQTTTINVSAEAETSKDETVYVLAGADGTVQKIIVSDWIKNAMATDSLDDKTELSDIENIHHGQIEHFQQTVICGEHGFCLGHFPKLTVESLDSIGRINQAANLLGILEIGAEIWPVIPPGPRDFGVFLVPTLGESIQSVQSRSLIQRCVDRLQI